MDDDLSLDYRPRLRHCTLVERSDTNEVTVIVGMDYFNIDIVDGSFEAFYRVKSLFDGRHTIANIHEKTKTPVESIKAIVQSFRELGLFRRETPTDTIKSSEFIDRVKASCDMWRKQIGYHNLFRELELGQADKRVFLGLLQETYHYVNSAENHISNAIDHCDDNRWKGILSDYLAEESDHGHYYVDTMQNLGVPANQVRDAHPIIGTMSLVNAIREFARQDTLAYFACTSLFEANPSDFAVSKKAFLEIANQYGITEQQVAPILEHMAIDVDAGHVSLLEQALEGIHTIDTERAHHIVNCIHDLKHSFDQYHDQILSYYSDISNYVPRLKVDYFSL